MPDYLVTIVHKETFRITAANKDEADELAYENTWMSCRDEGAGALDDRAIRTHDTEVRSMRIARATS